MLIHSLNLFNSAFKNAQESSEYNYSSGHNFSMPKLNCLNKDTISFSSNKTAITSISPIEKAQLIKDLDLDGIEKKSIQYFIDNRSPKGLVQDRAPNSDESSWQKMCSVAATGYGLTALVLASEKNIIPKKQAKEMVMQTLTSVDENTPEINGGWLAHFMDEETGKAMIFKDKNGNVTGRSEISSIDTAIFFFNAFAAAEYFGGDVKKQVEKMYNKIDFNLMLTEDGKKTDQLAFNLGFHVVIGKKGEERKFLPNVWDEYSEGILVPLLALGAKGDKKVSEEVWTKGWDRREKWEYNGLKTFVHTPLFTYFYPHGLLDLKDKVDKNKTNFWKASENAVKMQIDYCKDTGYAEGLFGITACDSPGGYHPDQPCKGANDGTIAPPAVIACLPFAEKDVLNRMRTLKDLGLMDEKYGPCNAYNVYSGWKAKDALGIDLGSMLLMTDSYRSGKIQKLVNQNKIVKRIMTRAGFESDTSAAKTL